MGKGMEEVVQSPAANPTRFTRAPCSGPRPACRRPRRRVGRVSVDAHGLLAHLPLVKSALQMFDGQIPAHADSEKLCLSTWIPPIPSLAFSRLADSRLRALLGRRTPDQVTISITEECPNRCTHCALPNSGNKLRLAPDTVKDIIGQILDMGTTLVIFDGGEPALYRELPELVASVDDRAISTLFTSGAGFTAALARQLKEAGLYAVNVSLDSPIETEHDAMRGRVGGFSGRHEGYGKCPRCRSAGGPLRGLASGEHASSAEVP